MRKLIIIAFALISNATLAQEWSLENCIMHAIENNIQVKESAIDIENAKIGVNQSKLDYIPSLGASLAHTFSSGRSLDPTTYNFIDNTNVNNLNGGVSLQTTAFAGMTKLHTLAKSKLNLQNIVQKNEQLKNEIVLSVTSAFLQVLYTKEQVANSLSQLELIKSQLERTIMLVDAGSLPLGSRLELEAQQSQEEYNLVNYKNQLANANLNLTQLLELRNVPNFDVFAPELDSIPIDNIANLDSTYNNALELPQIQAAQLTAKMAKEDVSLAKAKFYPTLTFGANYGSTWSDARKKPSISEGQVINSYYPFFSQLGDNASTSLQLSLNIPIFTSLRSQNNLKIAKWNMQKSELQIVSAENKLYKEVQQAYTDALAAKYKFISACSAVNSNEKSFQYAEQKFSAGATTSVDYNTAKNNLIIAVSTKTQAKYEFILRSKILDFYNGIPITL